MSKKELRRRRHLVAASGETTLAGRGYLRLVQQLRTSGWQVELIYLALPSIETSKSRVAERVAHGGHDIPARDLERRFSRSLHNLLTLFAPAVSRTRCFMNSGEAPELIFEQRGEAVEVRNSDLFEFLFQEAGL